MPKSPELPPVLTIHRTSEGSYALRLFDLADNFLAAGIAKIIPDLRTLLVITPTDMKVFEFNGNGNRAVAEVEELPRTEVYSDPMAEAIALAEEEPSGPKIVGETAHGTKVVRRKKSPTPEAGHTETCARCQGRGKVGVLLDGGQSTEGTCPLCQGSGEIRRYGARRTR